MPSSELKVKCVDAKETGIGLVEGKIYTVSRSFQDTPEWGGPPIPGYTLEEIGGRFRQDRFEVVNAQQG